MQVRSLVWLNFLIAFGLVAWAWEMLPFAHGVRCGLNANCPPLSIWDHTYQALAPGLIVGAFTLAGVWLAKRKPAVGRAILFTCPVVIVAWIGIIFIHSLI
jgi:hypothetical protein